MKASSCYFRAVSPCSINSLGDKAPLSPIDAGKSLILVTKKLHDFMPKTVVSGE